MKLNEKSRVNELEPEINGQRRIRYERGHFFQAQW